MFELKTGEQIGEEASLTWDTQHTRKESKLSVICLLELTREAREVVAHDERS